LIFHRRFPKGAIPLNETVRPDGPPVIDLPPAREREDCFRIEKSSLRIEEHLGKTRLSFRKQCQTGEEKRVFVTKYKIVVKGGGIIYDGESLLEADRTFETFVSESKKSDEMVTLLKDSDIVRQWYRHFEP
jgi:hypothetical protein